MPFGLALSLAGSLRDDLVRGHGEARHFLLIAARSDFWITPQVPDQDHVIDHCPTPPAARASPKGSPATARIHLGSHRDRRPAAAAPPVRPAQSSPSALFWLALSPTAGGRSQKPPRSRRGS